MTHEPPTKKNKIDPDGQKTYLISVEYEDTAAYPVKILMHGVAEEDRRLIEYMETHQEKPNSEWGTAELVAVQKRTVHGPWASGPEVKGRGFRMEWDIPVQHFYGSHVPYYFARIDRCLSVTIPDWASSSSSDSTESTTSSLSESSSG